MNYAGSAAFASEIPGLRPWAIESDPFGVKKAVLDRH
jgi:hypothetical protein